MTGLVTAVKNKKVIELKKLEVRLEHEVSSIQDRVSDLRWRIEGADDYQTNDLMDEHQRALDKLRQTKKELLEVREDIIEAGAF